MSPLLFLAIIVAIVGFVLLLRPEIFWRILQKEKDNALSNVMGAFLRLIGIGVLFLSVFLAQLV